MAGRYPKPRQLAQSNRPQPLVVGRLLEHAGEDTDRFVEGAPEGGDRGELVECEGERSALPDSWASVTASCA